MSVLANFREFSLLDLIQIRIICADREPGRLTLYGSGCISLSFRHNKKLGEVLFNILNGCQLYLNYLLSCWGVFPFFS